MQLSRSKLMALAVTAAAAVSALAAEHGEAQPNLFAGGIGNAVITLIIFGAVIAILGKFAWTPVLNLLNERERTIRESLENARSEREAAAKLLADYQKQLEKAREQATALVEEGRRDAEVARRRIQEEARAEADRMLERAKREIQLATDAAVRALYDEAADVSVRVAAGVLKSEISADKHRELVAASLKEMQAKRPQMN